MTIPLLCAFLAFNVAGVAGQPGGVSSRYVRVPQAARSFLQVAARGGYPPSSPKPASGQFLIAKRSVSDPNFAETVILLLRYGEDGAMGLMINRPTEMRLASGFPQLKELQGRPDRLFMGGPVAINSILLLVRSQSRLEGAQPIFGDVYASSSMQVLRDGVKTAGKTARLRAYAGYTGWGPGQLDREIERGDWLIGAADATTIFDTKPSDVWPKLFDRFAVEWARVEDQPRLVWAAY